MEEHEERAARMGEVVRDALVDLTESQNAFATRIGVSPNKFRQIRDGKPGNYRPDTLAKVSEGLWGRPDVLRRILEGSDIATRLERANQARVARRTAARMTLLDENIEALRRYASQIEYWEAKSSDGTGGQQALTELADLRAATGLAAQVLLDHFEDPELAEAASDLDIHALYERHRGDIKTEAASRQEGMAQFDAELAEHAAKHGPLPPGHVAIRTGPGAPILYVTPVEAIEQLLPLLRNEQARTDHPADIEDHARATESGEGPSSVERGPELTRPSADPEPGDMA